MRIQRQVLTGLFLCVVMMAVAANKRFTLVIDAGHGGHDAGAIGAFSKEKNINLNVALAFGRYVERNCPDVTVIYTRKTDVFIPLHTRASIANKNKADLFVSVHTNSLPAGRIARGMETYTLGMHRATDNLEVAKRENSVILIEKDYKQHYEGFDPRSSESYIMFEFMQDKNMAQSVELARYVQKRACASAGRPDKGVKQAGFLVLRETSMPSCLIELGFISTSDEEKFLNSEEGIDKLGKGIYQAFLDYKRKYDATVTVPYAVETQPSVTIPTVVPQEETTEKKPEKNKRKRSKAAQDLADARAGKVTRSDSPAQETVVDADSVGRMEGLRQTEPQTAPQPTIPQESREPVVQTAPEPAAKPAKATQPEPKKEAWKDEPQKDQAQTERAVFKVQILASTSQQAPNSPQLKGQKDVDCYQEGGMYKYTVGSSTNYQEIYQLRKTLVERFPEAFIVAFKNGQRTDIREAIREYRENKKP